MNRCTRAVVAAVLACACTQDFDAFHVAQGSDASGGSAGIASGGSGGASDASAGSGGSANSSTGGSADSSTGGSGGDAAADAPPDIVCPAGEKPCVGGCMSTSDPLTGCAATSCAPCNSTNANAVCDAAGQCAIGTCAAGFEDCDNDAGTGCESATASDPDNCGACGYVCGAQNVTTRECVASECTPTCALGFASCNATRPAADDGCETNAASDVLNCGGCGRVCSGANVASQSCTGGVCDSTCLLGSGNCSTPLFPTADNGCELAVSQNSTSCGGCGNSCTAQNGLVCGQDSTNFCGCDGTNARCRSGNSGGACLTSGLCSCPTGNGGAVVCRPGEYCQSALGGGSECTCNGGAACAAGQTCCQTPVGCINTLTDPANCGACGRACPLGFACASGLCRCASSETCAAGTTGTFECNASGFCVCDGATCTAGRRCQPNGQCG